MSCENFYIFSISTLKAGNFLGNSKLKIYKIKILKFKIVYISNCKSGKLFGKLKSLKKEKVLKSFKLLESQMSLLRNFRKKIECDALCETPSNPEKTLCFVDGDFFYILALPHQLCRKF